MGTSYPLAVDAFPNAATLAAQNLSTGPHSTIHGDANDAIEAIETHVGVYGATSYTPAWQGSGITNHSATWSGKYHRMGMIGFVSIKGAITGTWSVSSGGYIELGLPSGWETISGWSGGGLMGCGTAFANHSGSPFGLHYTMTPIVHDGGTGIRFINPQKTTVSANDLKSYTELAVDGVSTGPFDTAMVSGDEFWCAVTVLLDSW